MANEQPKLLAINQSVSTLFRDLADGMAAQGVQVKMLAGYLELSTGYTPPFEWIHGCELKKAPAWRRAWTWSKFTLQAMGQMIRHRDSLVLLVTNPPLVPWVAPLMSRLFGVRYVELIYDIFPDAMARMGLMAGEGLAYRFMRRLSQRAHQRAQCVITLGRCMRQTVLGQLDDPSDVEVHVIPNWADSEHIVPLEHADNPFSVAQGLTDKFVVMYSGAFGATHDIDSIVLAAESLLDLPDLRIVLIGGGTREAQVRQLVEQKRLPNLQLLPWQPVDQVKYSLTAADCHIVCLDEGYEGISVPSKAYTALAAGAALLAVSPPDTELTDLVTEHECGIWLRPRDVQGLCAAIRKLYENRPLLSRMKANSRRASVDCYSKERCVEQYVKLLMPLVRESVAK